MEFKFDQAITHAIGFIITFWLIGKFAWKPLLALMEERRNRIESEFKTIENEKAAVAQQQAEYEQRMRQIEDERRAELVKAVEEGKRVAAQLKEDAQREASAISDKAKADVEREVLKARVQLKDDVVAMTMTATEKVLGETLDDVKHRDMISRYIDDMAKA